MANSNAFFNKLNEQMGSNINCSIFAKVDSYNSNKNTITAIPISQPNDFEISPLVEVPILIFGNENYNIKIPISRNDVVLIIFIDYDYINLLINGEPSNASNSQVHSLNNAVALPFYFNAFKTQFKATNLLQIISKNDIELEFDGDTIKVTEIINNFKDYENRINDLEKRIEDLEK